MHLEPLAHLRQLGDEEIVEQIDVERAHADILQHTSRARLLGEPRGIVAEECHDDEHQRVHGQRARQVGPLHA